MRYDKARAMAASQLLEGTQEQFKQLKAHQRHLTLLNFKPCGQACRQNCGCKENGLSSGLEGSLVTRDVNGKAERLQFSQLLNYKLNEMDAAADAESKSAKSVEIKSAAANGPPDMADTAFFGMKIEEAQSSAGTNQVKSNGLQDQLKQLELRKSENTGLPSDGNKSLFLMKPRFNTEVTDEDGNFGDRNDALEDNKPPRIQLSKVNVTQLSDKEDPSPVPKTPSSILRKPSFVVDIASSQATKDFDTLMSPLTFATRNRLQVGQSNQMKRLSSTVSFKQTVEDVLSSENSKQKVKDVADDRQPRQIQKRLAMHKMRNKMTEKQRQTQEERGLKFLGRHVFEAKQIMLKEANQLYDKKVLIKRARTRDMMPPSVNTIRVKSDLQKLARSKEKNQQRTWSLNNNPSYKALVKQNEYFKAIQADTFSQVIEVPKRREQSPNRYKEDESIGEDIIQPRRRVKKAIDLGRHLHREEVRQHLGLNAMPGVRAMRIQRYLGELDRRKEESENLKVIIARKQAKNNVSSIFLKIFLKLKEMNKEKWAARVIFKWWRKIQVRLREIEAERWLPLDIDPETANFADVGRVLKVLDEYALKKLAKYEDEPLLPEIIRIQRAVRYYLVRTRLGRCVRNGIKFIKAMKAISRYENRSQHQWFFFRHEEIWRDDIEIKQRKRAKKQERQRRMAAGEAVSDSSSVKEEKRRKKEKYLAKLKQETMTTQEVIDQQKRDAIQQALYKQAMFTGKNITTMKKIEAKQEVKRETVHQKLLKRAKVNALSPREKRLQSQAPNQSKPIAQVEPRAISSQNGKSSGGRKKSKKHKSK